MTDLTLHGRRVETVFELLGDAEDDITYSVGWGLAQSEDLAHVLLEEVYGAAVPQGELTAIRLQESEPGTGPYRYRDRDRTASPRHRSEAWLASAGGRTASALCQSLELG
jgi:hypothetical protein